MTGRGRAPPGGEVGLVTGAGAGAGWLRIAARLAAGRARVRTSPSGRAEFEDGGSDPRAGGGGRGSLRDITSEPEVDALFARAVEAAGRLDVVVNNAGVIVGLPSTPALPSGAARRMGAAGIPLLPAGGGGHGAAGPADGS